MSSPGIILLTSTNDTNATKAIQLSKGNFWIPYGGRQSSSDINCWIEMWISNFTLFQAQNVNVIIARMTTQTSPNGLGCHLYQRTIPNMLNSTLWCTLFLFTTCVLYFSLRLWGSEFDILNVFSSSLVGYSFRHIMSTFCQNS